MSEGAWISLIAMAGWLVLMLGAYRSYQINVSKTLRMALIWACIFAGLTFFFTLAM